MDGFTVAEKDIMEIIPSGAARWRFEIGAIYVFVSTAVEIIHLLGDGDGFSF